MKTLTIANFKKIDEKDIVFINRPTNKKEDEAFSGFLKQRKASAKAKTKSKVKLSSPK